MLESQKVVQDAYNDFKRRIIEIDYLQSITKNVYQKTLLELDKRIQTEENYPTKSSNGINFFLRDIAAGALSHCELNIFSTTEEKRLVHELFNRQYQILLVDAYEAFKKFLEITYSKLSKSNTNFYIKKFHNENDDLIKFESLKFLKKLHSETPEIGIIINLRNIQDSKQPDIDMTLFLIALIEKLRHHIVHSQGLIQDKEKFIGDVIKNAGLSNKSTPHQRYRDELNVYLGNEQYSNLICLLEVYVTTNQFHDRLGDLIRELISYTEFIHGYIARHFLRYSQKVTGFPLSRE